VVVDCDVPCPPIDNIMRLMIVWEIIGKIIRTAKIIIVTYAQLRSAVLTILDLYRIFVLCVSQRLNFLFRYYVYVHLACKAHPRNDLYCVEQDVKPYSLTHLWTATFVWLKDGTVKLSLFVDVPILLSFCIY